MTFGDFPADVRQIFKHPPVVKGGPRGGRRPKAASWANFISWPPMWFCATELELLLKVEGCKLQFFEDTLGWSWPPKPPVWLCGAWSLELSHEGPFTVVNHPLVQHNLTRFARQAHRATGTSGAFSQKWASLMLYEATAVIRCELNFPSGTPSGRPHAGSKLQPAKWCWCRCCGAGLGMLDSISATHSSMRGVGNSIGFEARKKRRCAPDVLSIKSLRWRNWAGSR